MTETQIEQLTQTFAETLDVDAAEINDETSPKTIATWTSLTHLNLMAAVEEAFEIQMTMDEMGAIDTFAKLKETVVRHL